MTLARRSRAMLEIALGKFVVEPPTAAYLTVRKRSPLATGAAGGICRFAVHGRDCIAAIEHHFVLLDVQKIAPGDLYSDHPWSPPHRGHSNIVAMFECSKLLPAISCRTPDRRARRFGRSQSQRSRSANKKATQVGWLFCLLARPEGFEPPTTWFEARCSIQLSYGRAEEAQSNSFASRCLRRRSKLGIRSS